MTLHQRFTRRHISRNFESVITLSFSENQRPEITSCRTKLKETSLLWRDLSDCPEAIVSCSFRPIEKMKTLSRAGLARVASWGSDWFLRMFMSVIKDEEESCL